MDNKNQTPNATPTPTPSPAVVKRLPRYYRYLRELITQGKMRDRKSTRLNSSHCL